jgi:hypothetical protein
LYVGNPRDTNSRRYSVSIECEKPAYIGICAI